MTTRREILVGGFASLGVPFVGRCSPIKSMLGAEINGRESTESLPYDAEVEYIESTGTQFIDTEITPDITGISKIEFVVSVSGTVPWGCQNFTEVSGYGRYFTTSGVPGAAIRVAGRYYSIELDGLSKSYYINDTYTDLSSHFFKTPASGCCWLFGRSDTGVLGKVRIYSASFVVGGVLERDFFPVRFCNEIGEIEGAMYDRVSGSLFRNMGSDSFIIGPDK